MTIDCTDLKNRIHNFFFYDTCDVNTVGIELEFPIVNLDGKYDKTYDILLELSFYIEHELKFTKKEQYLFEKEETRDKISFEYSANTLEFSMEKSLSLFEIYIRFRHYFKKIQEYLLTRKYILTGMGMHPHWRKICTNALDTSRYKTIEHYLCEYNKYLYGDFCAYTCSVQTHISPPIIGLIPNILNVFSFLSMIKGYLFSNSVDLYPDSHFINTVCCRDYLWLNSKFAIHKNNVGYYRKGNDKIEDVIDDILERTLYYIYRNSRCWYIGPYKIKDYFSKDKIKACDIISGEEVVFSTDINDLNSFRSYKFIETTKRRTIEIRDDCQQPVFDCFSPAAFNIGIYENIDEVKIIARDMCQDLGINFFDFLNNRNIATSINCIFSKKTLVYYLDKFYELAYLGLKKRNRNEEKLLKNFFWIRNSYKSPGIYSYENIMLKRSNLTKLVEYFSCTDVEDF